MVKESSALPLVLVFAAMTALLVRSREVRWWEALLITIFGVYLGQTPVLFTVNSFVNWFLSGFSHT
ncbi:hypothetical protein ACIHFE_18810 [Streptomyces sp. NPDC052396]|uniref:hypothetical protein n=1 Tax=Streptomyces sp. NPDC052396 TaxID=3365689 RepID=UPI0037D20062